MVSQKIKNNEFNQGVTFKVYAQAHKRADGTNAIYLRTIIDRKKREINLKVYWPAEKFDNVKQIALPRFPKDDDAKAVNMVIEEAKGRANRIKLRYFTDGKLLTLDLFAKEFESYESRDNFLLYWEKKINENVGNGRLSMQSAVRHQTNLRRFKDFLNSYVFLSMSELTADLILRYHKWLTKKLQYNTVVNSLKILKTYINAAREEGFKIEDPFKKIKLRYQAGEREALTRDEVKSLQKLLEEPDLHPIMEEVLRKFLFSCFTGLRVSDSALVSRNMISNNILRFNPVKGRKFGKQIQLTVPDYAMKLIEGRKGLLFKSVADQTCNDWLKIIATKTEPEIQKNLSFHVARDTFATLFIEMGGDVYSLKELMGHSDIKTTSIYVKMSERRKEILMSNFNNL